MLFLGSYSMLPYLLYSVKNGKGWRKRYKLDARLKGLVSQATDYVGYKLKQGRLYYKDRLVIPKKSPRIQKVL